MDFLPMFREKLTLLDMDEKLMNRSVNEGFSGGEKKRNEILQMAVLEPKLAILDETDSGLDIDALKIVKGATGARNYTQCDSLLIGDKCGAHTFPYIEVRNSSARMEHEASTSKIGEDQMFYLRQRGLKAEDAVSMIVNGFCKRVFRELPMEFAVEAQKLLSVSLEGSVG